MGIEIGPFTLNYYGLIIMAGAVAGTWLAGRQAKKMGRDPDIVWDALIWLLLGGIVGARLWHILTPSASLQAQGITTSYYLSHPLAALAIWRGGLGIPGALAGGTLALYLFTHKRGFVFREWLDMLAPGVALGQAIGRLGNFVNQELYGGPTNLPWAIYIDRQHRIQPFLEVARYHPLFLYELLWNLVNMGILLWISRRRPKWIGPGDLFLVYLVVYFFGRFFLEFLRLDPSPVGGLNINQALAALVVIISLSALAWRRLGTIPGSSSAKPKSA